MLYFVLSVCGVLLDRGLGTCSVLSLPRQDGNAKCLGENKLEEA